MQGILKISALAALFLAGIQRTCAADRDFTGNWKVILSTPGQAINLWLIRVGTKEGKPKAELLSASVD